MDLGIRAESVERSRTLCRASRRVAPRAMWRRRGTSRSCSVQLVRAGTREVTLTAIGRERPCRSPGTIGPGGPAGEINAAR